MARAKQTDRAEARRRYRQTLAAEADAGDIDGGAELDYGERRPDAAARSAAKPARASQQATPGRTGFFDAFRLAYHPAHIREDLLALPQLARSRAFLAAVALILVGGAAWLLFPVRSGSVLFWELLVVPGSALAPQLVGGFFAPRASYLIGFFVGVIQTIVFVLVTVSPPVVSAYLAIDPTAAPDLRADQVLQALLSSSVTGALFAAAAAWYRRFLSLSSPRRAQASRSNANRRSSRR